MGINGSIRIDKHVSTLLDNTAVNIKLYIQINNISVQDKFYSFKAITFDSLSGDPMHK